MYLTSTTIHFFSLLYIIFIIIIILYCKKYFIPNYPKDFFIPNYPTYNELYVSELSKLKPNKLRYLAILPNADSFVSKNNLWNILRDTKFSYIVPETYLLDNFNDLARFKLNYQDNKLYILKKNIQNKKGIKLIKDTPEKIIGEYYNNDYKVLQEYIYNTVLGKVFVIRVYILAIKRKEEKVEVYYNKYNKLLFAKEKINNLAINNLSLITDSSCRNNPRNLRGLLDLLESSDLLELSNNLANSEILSSNLNKVLLGIKYIIEKQSNNVLPNLVKYQLFGVDIICNNNLECYLLEINKNPNMLNYHCKEEFQEKNIIKNDIINLVNNAKLNQSFQEI